jgi:hypothetical protein
MWKRTRIFTIEKAGRGLLAFRREHYIKNKMRKVNPKNDLKRYESADN